LWLVSNAFEDKRGTPLLGMKLCFKNEPALRRQFEEVIESAPPNTGGATCTSQTHGGFDNDAPAMNAVLTRILGQKPQFPFEPRDLDY
jgi:hypothetical protein